VKCELVKNRGQGSGGREKVAVAVAEAVNDSSFMFLQLITTNNSKAND
jgi:hypothetical protein